MQEEAETFVRAWALWSSASAGEKLPRLLGHALQGSKPNEVSHFEFCYTLPAESGLCNELELRNDFSRYFWLVAAAKADAETVANVLLQ